MNRKPKFYSVKSCILIFLITGSLSHLNAQSDIKAGGYYAGWMQGYYNNGRLPANEIDFSTLDYIIHFALFPKSNGTFDADINSIRESNSAALVNAAHNAGKKVLICIGGWNSAPAFRSSTTGLTLTRFVVNLVNFITTRGYDGIDIDWEPLEAEDAVKYTLFIKTLRTVLDEVQPGFMLTAANVNDGLIFSGIYQYLDQINIMSYDLSGPWGRWVSWHNAPVYDGGYKFPGTNKLVPSADGLVKDFIAAGVPANKIAIGIDFYGYIWKGGTGTISGGITEPRQQWIDPPVLLPNKPYFQIMEQFFRPDLYRWDSSACASYLCIDKPCDQTDMFISYDDERTCKAKVEYAKKKILPEYLCGNLVPGFSQIPASSR
jgi:chitinase